MSRANGSSAADRLYLAAEVPTLIIWGDHDNIIPVDQGRATHEAIPGSRLEIFEGVGHFPHCDAARSLLHGPHRLHGHDVAVEDVRGAVAGTAPLPQHVTHAPARLHSSR